MRTNKYRARKCVIDGIAFDSRKEGKRYAELELLQRAGKICNLRRQVSFLLIPTQYETVERYSKNGQRLKDGQRVVERECNYIADFVYEENGKTVVEDVKGLKTEVYKIKKKLMLKEHGIRVREI